jgi:hypothetical protein
MLSRIFSCWIVKMSDQTTMEVQIEIRGINKQSEGRSCILHLCCGKSLALQNGDEVLLNHVDVHLNGTSHFLTSAGNTLSAHQPGNQFDPSTLVEKAIEATLTRDGVTCKINRPTVAVRLFLPSRRITFKVYSLLFLSLFPYFPKNIIIELRC